MAKLYFRYGTVGSAKTLNLLAVAHSYTQQGKKILVMKPSIDTRFGAEMIKSRAGLERAADLIVTPTTVLEPGAFESVHCVLVDEAQWLSTRVIEQLRDISTSLGIPVICYGLRGDFRTKMFEGSTRLMELADEISEVKTTCFFCNRKAIYNLKLLDGKPTLAGPVIDLGTEEKYLPACSKCYTARLPEVFAGQPPEGA